MPHQLSRLEFIALMAMLFATIAFSLDAMLPALPAIAADLAPGDLASAQLVVTAFVLGMGVGTFFTGPLSDALGRKPVILAGAALYAASAWAATQTESLTALLVARMLQGLGAAGPRVVALAIVRDIYSGRGMARIMSFVMMVFTLVPAFAPSIGAVLLSVGGWRAIFWAFVVFAGIAALWLALRLPETLPASERHPFRVKALRAATGEVLRHPVVRIALIVQALSFGMLFSVLSSVQPIYDAFGRADSFPLWFGGIAIVASSASVLNAALVMRLGMRVLITAMLTVQVVLSGAMVCILLAGVSGPALFGCFVVWQASLFFQAGLTIGNLNALALEPMGHIAGTAASVTSALATVLAVGFAVPVTLAFDGTPMPLALGVAVYAALALLLMLRLQRRGSAEPT
ncbi:MFS transporter [Citreimonas salinaria]|uniref:MFS transporter, DHA1 family, bicyclomycin/chloramphenicol resistance protein n=1 Tax=Citreimonas salinaria TaxID=321339 RepID=A0A1H3IGJ6_9RHOB|nr:MFS transporter [Citreimonas salinaria]SDY26737.1 MFS transporter, DHA1 family, bicyclomycin/chloramphenicol resistance protein [Citreimonas salinaria]